MKVMRKRRLRNTSSDLLLYSSSSCAVVCAKLYFLHVRKYGILKLLGVTVYRKGLMAIAKP